MKTNFFENIAGLYFNGNLNRVLLLTLKFMNLTINKNENCVIFYHHLFYFDRCITGRNKR